MTQTIHGDGNLQVSGDLVVNQYPAGEDPATDRVECPICCEGISPKARRCPHCRADLIPLAIANQYRRMKRTGGRFIFSGVLVLALSALTFSYSYLLPDMLAGISEWGASIGITLAVIGVNLCTPPRA